MCEWVELPDGTLQACGETGCVQIRAEDDYWVVSAGTAMFTQLHGSVDAAKERGEVWLALIDKDATGAGPTQTPQ
ncbi:hypothetical protein GCM10009841_36000 [Microlunatus panaciterrae]|uniref:Membrane protein n=1 Tax=Microlunatus panaciterrae TaxID=400768 RepID=A0ABS2RGX2_9ACTN|nr:putative membrane protein [Microlunatus panaciterrae]